MKFATALGLIRKATEKIEKQKWWDVWLVNFSKMTQDTYESFDTFYDRMTTPICEKSSNDIMSEVDEIRKKVRERDGNI
jgi:hypothetical protein